jgi:hypothetical protein
MMDALLTELNRSDLEFVDTPALAHQLQALPQKRRPAAPVRDVSSWFPTEYRVAQRLIAHHLRNADPNLVALHLVAASVVGGTVADAHLMAAELDHITRLLPAQMGMKFLTHMRLFLTRVLGGQQLDTGLSAVRASLATNHPEAMRVGRNIARLVADDLGMDITEDEETFLALHAARLLDH